MAKTADVEFPLLGYMDDLVEDLRKHVPAALKKWETDAIHDARVSTRRLKASLDLLDPVLTKEHRKPFARVLKRLRRRLGPLRDLDVMIEHLQELTKADRSGRHAGAIAWLQRMLEQRRQQAREHAADQPGSAARVLARLGAWWGLREEVSEAGKAVGSLLAESLHLQLDRFAEQADELVVRARGQQDPQAPRQDPHQLRIAGKALRYTLEMAAAEGHAIPAIVARSFKKMQEALGLWHDFVVLSECALQASVDELLAHHDIETQQGVLELARVTLRRAAFQLEAFAALWQRRGVELSAAIRACFPLSRPLSAEPATDSAEPLSTPQTDPDPPGSQSEAVPEATAPGAA